MTSGPSARNRRQLLLAADASLNGIDYVQVAPGQTRLYVHFLNKVRLQLRDPKATITGGDAVTSIAINPIDEATDWSADNEGRPILALTVAAPGDFPAYRLTLFSEQPEAGGQGSLDPLFDSALFSFNANSPTTLDCMTPPAPSWPAPAAARAPIDYLAKDFASFRKALSEFSALRYPTWVERSEADLGVMLMEALAAIADELSYYQDRVSAESTIETATQRLSAVRHARLADYERPGNRRHDRPAA